MDSIGQQQALRLWKGRRRWIKGLLAAAVIVILLQARLIIALIAFFFGTLGLEGGTVLRGVRRPWPSAVDF